MKEDEDDYFVFEGVRYPWIADEVMHKRFYAGTPIEAIAKARGCSVGRAKELIRRQRETYERIAMQEGVRARVEFDKAMVKYDPSGSSTLTMAFLQPMRKFLERI
jgi:hypothetical protein